MEGRSHRPWLGCHLGEKLERVRRQAYLKQPGVSPSYCGVCAVAKVSTLKPIRQVPHCIFLRLVQRYLFHTGDAALGAKQLHGLLPKFRVGHQYMEGVLLEVGGHQAQVGCTGKEGGIGEDGIQEDLGTVQ